MGVATGCGFKEIYRFPHTTYPLLLLYLYFFAAASLLFFHFVKMILHSCFSTFLKLHFRY